ncbi:DoxX family protein [Natronolimnobius sp. AArcel1]|uniref:DoxX family membrane protein n=1 Tax=Natronolimnobius sp. AArcel1 TaxID=1679093 RepID=UPI0013EAC931|nr:DoxX family membrane protein [Natronolimnobius sp. AArcel1]NGM70661.1 DoxX family protein [Natronolimnobius sp. AArcel1]
MTDRTTSAEPPSLLGRALYSGVLAYMAVDGFKSNEKRVEIADSKGVPLPEIMVPAATALLLVANIGILLWKYPRASAVGLIVFFLGTTPQIHDFWNMEGKDRNDNKINFCKNLALIGGAIVLLTEAHKDR